MSRNPQQKATTPPRTRVPKVVIVGAGFGGLAVARRLKDAPAQVTLIDRQNHHLFQPLLYQVATAAVSPADVAVPIRLLFRGNDNVMVMMDEVTGIDTAARAVLNQAVVTSIEVAEPFYPAEDYHQNYYKKNPLRYKFYRYRCGRDARIKELWGKDAHRGIAKH